MPSASHYLYLLAAALVASFLYYIFLQNRDNRHRFTSPTDFPFNNDLRLAYDLLLYQDNTGCEQIAQQISKSEYHVREARAISNTLFEDIFGRSVAGSTCALACLDMGSPAKYVTRVIPEKRYHFGAETNVSVNDWYNDVCEMKEVGFGSYGKSFAVYWLNATNDRVLVQAFVEAGFTNTLWLESYVGHKFEIVDPGSGASLGVYEVTHDAFYAVGQFVSGVEICAYYQNIIINYLLI